MKNGKQIIQELIGESPNGLFQWDNHEMAAAGVTPSRNPVPSRNAETLDTVEVMLLHEDLQTGLRGKYILDNLEAKLEKKPRFLVELWRFDMLLESDLQEQAIRDAKRANIVIISLHGHVELPMAVRNWFHRWIKSRNSESCALVISLDSGVEGTVAAEWTLDYLRRAAAPAGLDVFPHYARTPGRSRDWTIQHPVQPSLPVPNLGLGGRQVTSPRHFGGINE